MSQHAKLVERFLTKPVDFTWQELTTLLGHWNYNLINGGKTGGSRARFIHEQHPAYHFA